MMMQDKERVNDYLTGLNASLMGYAKVITETDDESLRQTIIQLRNQDEVRQRTLYEYAVRNNYYMTSKNAPSDLVHTIKNELSGQ